MARAPEPQKSLVDRLIASLQQDEFALYAQSIVPLAPQNGEPPFQEIFVRFKEEDAKLLPPGTFFPVLEECQLLPYLDRWVANRLARWVRGAVGIKPDWAIPRNNVNLSEATLVDPDYGQYVCKYVDDSYLSDGALGFEISLESAIAHEESLRKLMAEVRPFGCTLTLSGFDGSEASFAKLKGLTPEFIKISASIATAKLSEIGRKCQAFGIKTIAEHVESKQMLQHLRQSKIDFAQGFEISPVKPL
ncbi:MAG TPA: EAL domain-containing protein [Burkholderiales bacterium]|jgi:EAL domain-containing protein (putative c-di-GMP-specific phosphodiesterase class I)|nr:EAL domain-containing protein [Burkholderiales bacterium]